MRAIAYVLAAALLFAGCAEDKPREPAKTATPSPTVAAPSMPAQAMGDPPEGAAAFVSHYIRVFNYAARTGDTSQLLMLSSNCEACSKYAKKFQNIYAGGDHVAKDLWKSNGSEVLLNKDNIEVIASVQSEEDGHPVVRNFGFTLPSTPPYKVTEIFEAVAK